MDETTREILWHQFGAAIDMLFLDFPDAISPTAAGMGEDARLLGLALREAECRVLSHRVDSVRFAADADAGWPVRHARLTPVPGLLRLQSAGPVPAGVRFGFVGGTMTVLPVAVADGWQASLPLAPGHLRAGRADILCLAADAALPDGDLDCEIWSDPPSRRPVLQDQPEALDVTLFAVRDVGLAPHLALTVPPGADPATPPSGRLPLPSTFAFHEDGSGLGLLGEGWSHPEPEWVWSNGTDAGLHLPAPAGATAFRIEASALLVPGVDRQRVVLSAADTAFATVLMGTIATRRFVAILPPGCAPDNTLQLGLPDAVAPVNGGFVSDPRQLALRLQRLDIEALPTALLQGPRTAPQDSAVIVRHAVLAGGGHAIVVAGPGAVMPFGLAMATLSEVSVVAHALPGPGGWQAYLTLDAEDIGPERDVAIYVYATSADMDNGVPTDLLTLTMPMQAEG